MKDLSFDLVVVGGGIGGVTAALTAKRSKPNLSVALISFKPLTYPRPDLAAYLRDPSVFNRIERYGAGELEALGIRVFEGFRAVDIDGEKRLVKVECAGEKRNLCFNRLILATGSFPIVPSVEGRDLPGVFTLKWVEDAAEISKRASPGVKVCVVGGGIIGLEVAEALRFKGAEVTVVEALPFILGGFLESDLAEKIVQSMLVRGVRLLRGKPLEAIRGKGKVEEVLVDGGKVEADLVVLAVGLRPNSQLAGRMGLALSRIGAVKTDRFMRSSLEGVYAVGDVAETLDYVAGKPVYRPLGSIAALSGEVAGLNVAGLSRAYEGFIRVQHEKLFGVCMGSIGLTVREAETLGVLAEAVNLQPEGRVFPLSLKGLTRMKAVVEKGSDVVVGWQMVGSPQADPWIYWGSQLFLKAILERLTLSQVQVKTE